MLDDLTLEVGSRSEDKSKLPVTPQQLIYERVQFILSNHADKIAAKVEPDKPNRLWVGTRFSGYNLDITSDKDEEDTTATILLTTNDSVLGNKRYRLEVKYGKNINKEFFGVLDIIEKHQLTPSLLDHFIQTPDGTPIKFDDFYDEQTMKPQEALEILQKADTFEFPYLDNVVSLQSLKEHGFQKDFLGATPIKEIT